MKDTDASEDDGPVKRMVQGPMKYAGMAYELAALILLGVFGGRWLDEKVGFDKPYLTIGVLLLVLVGYFIRLIKSLKS